MTRRARLIAFVQRIAHLEEASRARPGERFVVRYEARAAERSVVGRISRIALAFGLFAFGLINVFIPGPGGSLFILASALVLSGESRRFAALLDRAELRFERQAAWMLAHPFIVSGAIMVVVFTMLAGVGHTLAGGVLKE